MLYRLSIAADLWITLATWEGIPVSTTHSTVGAVPGIGFAYMLLEHKPTSINWNVVFTVILNWTTSPLLVILLSMILYFLFTRLEHSLSSKSRDLYKVFKYILLFNLAFSEYAFGANDVGNATGVYVSVISRLYGVPDTSTMLYLALLGTICITVGALI